MIKLWCISDIHTWWDELIPPKDIDGVIIAGDLATTRSPAINANELRAGLQWLEDLPYRYKIFVPGNHDTSFEQGLIKKEDFPSIDILIDEFVHIGDIKIYGSPYTPAFGYGWAYNKKTMALEQHWEQIPIDADIVVTHGPPYKILDETRGIHCGDMALAKRIGIIKPIYHIFGHFHNEIGANNSIIYSNNGTTYVNASVVDYSHNVVNNGKIIGIWG